MQSPLFLEPILQERIWGGKALEAFHYEFASESVGECWGISAHPHGPNVIRNGKYKGYTLAELWAENRKIFGNYPSDTFPLLTKILDANRDLSVQVHPGDDFAKKYENGENGKTECWYIIDCKEGAELVFGHYAKTKEQFAQMVEQGKWNELLRRVPIKPGDFFYVPSGTIHALCEGTLVLETQQSSDTTYRVYDYDRIDASGKKRELHLNKAIQVCAVPHQDYMIQEEVKEIGNVTITTFVKEQYFSVYKWEIRDIASLKQNQCFMVVSVIDGSGTIVTDDGEFSVRRGDHFILPNTIDRFSVNGKMEWIVSHP